MLYFKSRHLYLAWLSEGGIHLELLPLKQERFGGAFLVGSAVFDPLSSSPLLGFLDLQESQCDIHLLS